MWREAPGWGEVSGLFWTLILSNYTDEEISELSRYAKWYENERLHVDYIEDIINKLKGIG